MIKRWGDKPFHSLDFFNKSMFGGKVYKLSIDGGMTCPNRDGKISTNGCIFCSAGGSGDFAMKMTQNNTHNMQDTSLMYGRALTVRKPDIHAELTAAKSLVEAKINRKNFAGYFAYFQSYTNTYASLDYLRDIYTEAINYPEVIGLSIGTRPDCLEDEKIALIAELSKIKPIFVELGLQTIHEDTATTINRGYGLEVFEDALMRLNQAGIPVVVHVILGLPGEDVEDMMASCEYLAHKNIQGIKLHLLHVLEGTALAKNYSECMTFSLEEYSKLIVSIIEKLPPELVIHRITGDGPRKLLIAPTWSLDKKNVLNTIMKEFATQDTWQGKYYDN